MRKTFLIFGLVLGLVVSWSMVCAEDDFYVIAMGKKDHAPVEKTGQSGCWDSSGGPISCTGTGQDGEYQKGVLWPSPRFKDNLDGTVKDNLTGLIWLKNANCPNLSRNWSEALAFANSLYDGWTGDPGEGDCDLSDGSSAGEWRLANIKELQGLIDFGNLGPALPSGHPFTDVQTLYWSSTTSVLNPNRAWLVSLGNGNTNASNKGIGHYVWPVRGGQ